MERMERMLRVVIIGYLLIYFSHDSEWYILFFSQRMERMKRMLRVIIINAITVTYIIRCQRAAFGAFVTFVVKRLSNAQPFVPFGTFVVKRLSNAQHSVHSLHSL